jgi:hypothetical protein
MVEQNIFELPIQSIEHAGCLTGDGLSLLRSKTPFEMICHTCYEIFFRWEIMVQRRAIDTNLGSDVTRPQALETIVGDGLEGGLQDHFAAHFGVEP